MLSAGDWQDGLGQSRNWSNPVAVQTPLAENTWLPFRYDLLMRRALVPWVKVVSNPINWLSKLRLPWESLLVLVAQSLLPLRAEGVYVRGKTWEESARWLLIVKHRCYTPPQSKKWKTNNKPVNIFMLLQRSISVNATDSSGGWKFDEFHFKNLASLLWVSGFGLHVVFESCKYFGITVSDLLFLSRHDIHLVASCWPPADR